MKLAQYMPTNDPMVQSPNYPNSLPMNPLAAGVQFGIMGAASGLGYSAIQRAVRLNSGNQTPPQVLKHLMIGSLIGAALGTGGSMLAGIKKPVPGPRTWYDLADRIHSNVYGYPKYGSSKYAGLANITSFEKKAWLPTLARIGLGARAAIPALFRAGILGGSVLSAHNALRGIGESAGYALRGEGKRSLKSFGGAVPEALFAAWGLAPVGRYMRMAPQLQRLAAAGGKLKAPMTAPGWFSKTPGKPWAVDRVAAGLYNRLLAKYPRISKTIGGINPARAANIAARGRQLENIGETAGLATMPLMGYQMYQAFKPMSNYSRESSPAYAQGYNDNPWMRALSNPVPVPAINQPEPQWWMR